MARSAGVSAFLPMLMPSTPFQRARRTLRMNASTPTLLKPKRLMIAWRLSRRKRRGRALPGCGRGVTVPTSRKPKPSAPKASMCSAFLSSPAARPMGFANSMPIARTGARMTGGEKSAATPAVRSASWWAFSASSEKRKGRASPYRLTECRPALHPWSGGQDGATRRRRSPRSLELRLVRHLRALADPVAEIEIGQAEALALLDLPEHVVGAEARAPAVGLVERIDRREAVGQVIDDRYHHQLACLAEFDEARIDAALQQEVGVLVAAIVVHAAAGMALGLVAQIERVVLEPELERLHMRGERRMRLPRAALRAVGLELAHRNAHRHARAAGVAMRAVREDAAAAKAGLDEIAVQLGVDEMARRRHLRTRHPVRQVAARVGGRYVKLQYGMRQVVKS